VHSYFSNGLHLAFAAAWAQIDIDADKRQHHFFDRFFGHLFDIWQPVQLTDYYQVFSPVAICKKAIMPDFDKSIGQRMEQKSSDKFNRIDGGLLDLFGFTIHVGKGYLAVVKRFQTMVGDGHPMGVAAQIFQYLFRVFNGIFQMNDPVFGLKGIGSFATRMIS